MTRRVTDLTERLSPFEPADPPSDAELAALRQWLPGRRWFPVKENLAGIDPWLSVRFADGNETVTHLLRAHGPAGTVVVHVPVVRRPAAREAPAPRADDVAALPTAQAPTTGADPSLIDRIGDVELHDAYYEQAYWRSWLSLAQWGEADGAPAESFDLTDVVFITGEQSNSSIVFPHVAGGSILKVFRALAPGPNPDVDVPRALVQTGWEGVPRPLAWLELAWSEQGAGPMDLGVLSEFVAGSSDGFQLACAYAAEDRSFAEESHSLGQTIAQLHAALAGALPTPDQSVGLAWLRSELRRRAREAAANHPVLAGRARAIDALIASLGAHAGPDPDGVLLPLQHIHGDLHLGQTLYSAESGWHVLDFEGEPMRPLAERLRPDLAVRDVAAMLRSFDYAAAVGDSQDPQWTADARESFLAGYRETAAQGEHAAVGPELSAELLRALELDKALYEVGYESANRPDWVAIPLAGIDRILTSANA